MANPQRSGWRSEIRVCTCGLGELERSVLVIFSRGRPMAKYYWKAGVGAIEIFWEKSTERRVLKNEVPRELRLHEATIAL